MKITCPQCGANIQTQPRSVQLICPFCKTQLLLKKEPFLESYAIEPTCEKKPTQAIAEQFLATRNRTDSIQAMQMLYLPFYRFLYERKGTSREEVVPGLDESPFLLAKIPSGQILSLKHATEREFMKPERNLKTVLEMLKQKKIQSLEEILLLYIPFWKIVISSGETIWIDAVQGKILTTIPAETRVRKSRLLALSLTGLLAFLLLEGLSIPSLAFGIAIQGVSALGFFYIIRRILLSET